MRPVMLTLNLRAFAVLALTILVAGCAQQQPPAMATKSDCFSRFSGGTLGERDKYTLLGPFAYRSFYNAVNRARLAARKTFGEPAAARLPPADAELARTEAELASEKAEAEAVNRKLDETEARVEAGKAQMRECFGVGYDGKQAAENYAQAKKAIADYRKSMTRDFDRVLERHRSAAERAAFVERWRADNASHLKKRAGNADLEIVEVARGYLVAVAVTNATSTTILRPQRYGRRQVGVSMWDSFGNTFELFLTRFPGVRAIRPGETEVFELEFADMPLENAKSLRIAVEPGMFGQSQRAVFDIPTEVFFRGIGRP